MKKIILNLIIIVAIMLSTTVNAQNNYATIGRSSKSPVAVFKIKAVKDYRLSPVQNIDIRVEYSNGSTIYVKTDNNGVAVIVFYDWINTLAKITVNSKGGSYKTWKGEAYFPGKYKDDGYKKRSLYLDVAGSDWSGYIPSASKIASEVSNGRYRVAIKNNWTEEKIPVLLELNVNIGK